MSIQNENVPVFGRVQPKHCVKPITEQHQNIVSYRLYASESIKLSFDHLLNSNENVKDFSAIQKKLNAHESSL